MKINRKTYVYVIDNYNKLITAINSVAEGVGDSIDKMIGTNDRPKAMRSKNYEPPVVISQVDPEYAPTTSIPYDKKAPSDQQPDDGNMSPDQTTRIVEDAKRKSGGIQKKKK